VFGAPRSTDGSVEIDLQVEDSAGTAVEFGDVGIDVEVTLSAGRLDAPEQPPRRIGGFTREVRFEDLTTATLVLSAGDLSGFDPGEDDPNVEVTIGAAAYPGLQGAVTTIDLS
jgi:hypothetical protein